MRRFFLLIFLIHFSLRVYANQTDYPPITPENIMNLREVEVLGSETETYSLLGRVIDRMLLYGPDDSIGLVDSTTMQEIAILPLAQSELLYPYIIYERGDGNLLLESKDRHLVLRVNPQNGETLARFDNPNQAFNIVNYSPDYRYLMNLPDPYDRSFKAQLWDANTGEMLQLPENYRLIRPYFYDETHAIAWTGESVVIFEPESGEIAYELASSYEVTGVGFSADKAYLIFGGDFARGTLYRRSTGEVLLDGDLYMRDFDFSPDSQYFAYEDGDFVNIMRLNDESIVHRIEFPDLSMLLFLSDSRLWLVSYDEYTSTRTDAIYEFETWELSDEPIPAYEARPVVVTESLQFFLEDYDLNIRDRDGRLLFTIDAPYNFGLSSDETRIFIEREDGRIGIWAVGD